ncbi:hypothetical protein BT69DRAFT_1358428 [Atractiella rhizophila]|nr:hypothetical protein BT69DRAFT_1358428 [Atractiella rhizophila]
MASHILCSEWYPNSGNSSPAYFIGVHISPQLIRQLTLKKLVILVHPASRSFQHRASSVISVSIPSQIAHRLYLTLLQDHRHTELNGQGSHLGIVSSRKPFEQFDQEIVLDVKETQSFYLTSLLSVQGRIRKVADRDGTYEQSMHAHHFVQLQLHSFQSPIARLPDELLEAIFCYFNLLLTEEVVDFLSIPLVCRKWLHTWSPYLKEPSSSRQKAQRLKRLPCSGRLWKNILYTSRDDEDDVDVKTLVSAAPNVSRVALYHCPRIWFRKIDVLESLTFLIKLSELEVTGRCNYSCLGWTMEDVSWFLRNTKGNEPWKALVLLGLSDFVFNRRRRFSSKYNSLRKLVIQGCDINRPSFIECLSIAEFQGLQFLELSYCWPVPAPLEDVVFNARHQESLQALVVHFSSFHPDDLDIILSSRLQQAIQLHNFSSITDIDLDGGHDNSHVVSPDFFLAMRRAVSQRRLTWQKVQIKWCSMDFQGFTDFFDIIFETDDLFEFRLHLFFGDWEEEHLQEAQAYFTRLTDHFPESELREQFEGVEERDWPLETVEDRTWTFDTTILFYAEALYSWFGDEEGDLRLERGDVVGVTAVRDTGWWEGVRCRFSMHGDIPSNFVRRIQTRSEGHRASFEELILFYALALYDFSSERHGDLRFKKGDMLAITGTYMNEQDGWWIGKKLSFHESGSIPSNFMRQFR